MNVLHIVCSSRGIESESTRLGLDIIQHLSEITPLSKTFTRTVAENGITNIDRDYATSQQAAVDVSEKGTAACSDQLISELEQADVLIISTPMHNFSLPSALKSWIDHIARVRRTFTIGADGKTGLLRDRPVYIAIASGGKFSGDRARQPDYLTPYLTAILNMLGLHALVFFSVEGTAMGEAALVDARIKAGAALRHHFSSNTHA